MDIFKFKFPDCIGVWIFDCSSNHEGFVPDALNVNNMNVNPGGKQMRMHSTVIPANNPPPTSPGKDDSHGKVQLMVYIDDDPKVPVELQGKPKGMKAILQEQHSIWDRLVLETPNHKPIGTCEICWMSQAAKDAATCVAAAEASGGDVNDMLAEALDDPLSTLDWCCMTCILLLQSDFMNEKPLIQQYVEK